MHVDMNMSVRMQCACVWPNCVADDSTLARPCCRSRLIGSTQALTRHYHSQLEALSARLGGCCSAALCAAYGLPAGANCSIDALPMTWNGVYWKGLYDGPLHVAAMFAQAWMLQVPTTPLLTLTTPVEDRPSAVSV